jgi:hypothetical protein
MGSNERNSSWLVRELERLLKLRNQLRRCKALARMGPPKQLFKAYKNECKKWHQEWQPWEPQLQAHLTQAAVVIVVVMKSKDLLDSTLRILHFIVSFCILCGTRMEIEYSELSIIFFFRKRRESCN